VTSGSSTAHAATDLTAETAAIDAARSALRQRRTADALALLDAYSRRFPQGTFEPEATALRIEALLPGDRAEGARLAREFLTAHPTGPLADRVRDLLNR
jgi:outer membrane protein assembly factor BamD (BamD/ComL family)